MNASSGKSRKPREGERCACGKPAKIVYVKLLGDVPACELPAPIEPPLLRAPLFGYPSLEVGGSGGEQDGDG